MTSKIVQLWVEGLVPGWDGLYRADGSARAVAVGGGARLDWFDLSPPLDLDLLLDEDPDNLTHVDIHPGADVPLPKDRNLVWIVALTDSNPFEKAELRGPLAMFTNNLGKSVTVDLDHPNYA